MVDFVNAAKSDKWILSRRGTFISDDLHAQVHNFANNGTSPHPADIRIVAARQSSVPMSQSREADRVHSSPLRDSVFWPGYASDDPWPWLAAALTAAIAAPWFMPGERVGAYLLAGYTAGGLTFYATDLREKQKELGSPVDLFILKRQQKTISQVPEQASLAGQHAPPLAEQIGSLVSA